MQTAGMVQSACSRDLIDFFNYYLPNGPLDILTGSKDTVEQILETYKPGEAARRFGQELGGAFTSRGQLTEIPGMNRERLLALDRLVSQLDLAKLRILAPKTSWNNRVDAYINGPESLKMMLAEINAAKRYIHLSVMLFFNDQSGNLIADALLSAIARGVVVRIMVNFEVTVLYGLKSKTGDFRMLAEKIRAAGGKVINTFLSCFNKLEWPAMREELEKKGVAGEVLFLQDQVQSDVINGLDVVNHRKFIVIDGQTSIVGSQNIGDVHLYQTPVVTDGAAQFDGNLPGIPRKEEEWHDGCFRIQGAAAQHLNQLFYSQWAVLGGDLFDANDSFYGPETDPNCGDEECTLFTSFPGNPVNLIQAYYLSLVTYAADETIIVNPYLIDQQFWERLKSLEKEPAGCLSICNPLTVNDVPMNQPAVLCNMYKPCQNGITFYDYSKTGRFSHWKIAYDKRSDCVFHGSYNLNTRSAVHDFEMGILVKSKPFADQIKTMIDYDLQHSERIKDANKFYKHPMLHLDYYLHAGTKHFC